MKKLIGAAIAVAFLLPGTPALSQEKIVVWWSKSFNKAENDSLLAEIAAFEKKTGVKVDLSLYATQDMIPKVVSALDAGNPPDVAHVNLFDMQTAGKWAFEGKLDDLTPMLEPIKDIFAKDVLETTYLYNDQDKKHAYYAFPVKMQSFHNTYWIDMLETAGFKEADIPDTWNEYWSFWCDKVQPAYRKATGKRVYGIGLAMSVGSSDTYQIFMDFLDAYNVEMVDKDGKLLVDDPETRKGIISALDDFTKPYINGCVPPSATGWKDPDNNVAFNNRTVLMTPNGTISVAVKWLDDSVNPALTKEQQEQALKNYKENIRTMGFPKKPDGSPMVNRIAVKIGLVFKQGQNVPRAREFAQFLLTDERLTSHVEGGLGRFFPVTKAGQAKSFWQEDPHRKTVYDQITGPAKPYEFIYNYKFATLNNENVWAVALNRIVNDKISPEQAADELIARIKKVVND